MSSTLSTFKTLVIPAVVALLLFLVGTYVVFPLWTRYRNRYSQYLPLDTITTQTSSLRHRVQSSIGRLFLPSTWRRNRVVVGSDSASDNGAGSEDGEELGEVDDERGRRDISLDGRPDFTRRLSRELEEGFMDDSEDEQDSRRNRR